MTTLGFKDLIDLPEWRPLSISPENFSSGGALAFDARNNLDANPYVYSLQAISHLSRYNKFNDEWMQVYISAGNVVGGSVAAGAFALFVPSHGPSGTIGVSPAPTTAAFALATLPNSANISPNQLANQGNGRGFKIRVKDNGAGGTGKTEEVLIVANSGGTAPTVTVSPSLTFTPVSGSTYEILSGRLYLLGSGATSAGSWKCYDIATESYSGNLSTTNLAGTIGTATIGVVLDELYVPYNVNPGDGLINGGGTTYNNGASNAIQATAADGTHITGSLMPAGLLASEFINFQIRIVEDGTTPTSVGQRRKITAHGSGASAQFTVATWATTPSSSAKFVVEGNNDILLWTNNAAVTYSYAAGGFAADANWSTASVSGGATQYANITTGVGAGTLAMTSLSIVPDSAKNVRNSHVLVFQGGTTKTLYQFDIANGANGTWSTVNQYGGQNFSAFQTGNTGAHDMVTNGGRYFYINLNGTQRFYRFDVLNRVVEPWCYMRFASGFTLVGVFMACYAFIDGSTKLGFTCYGRENNAEFFNVVLQR